MGSLILSPQYILTFLSEEETNTVFESANNVRAKYHKQYVDEPTETRTDEFTKQLAEELAAYPVEIRSYKIPLENIMLIGELAKAPSIVARFLCGGKVTIVTSPVGTVVRTNLRAENTWWDYRLNRAICENAKQSWATVLAVSKLRGTKYGVIWKRS